MNLKQSVHVWQSLLLSTLSFLYDIVCFTFIVALITVVLYGSFTGVIVPY